MLQIARHEQILSALARQEVLSVTEAARRFGASAATTRRDFDELARQNLVRRVRGGIRSAKPLAADILPFAMRELHFAKEKSAVAARAAQLLRPGEVVFIDGGTTTSLISHHLPNFPIRVITNSVLLAASLEERRGAYPDLEVYMTGGFLYPTAGLLVGPNAIGCLAQYRADWAFLAAAGVTVDGIFNSNEMMVETERKMIEHARQVCVLTDHSKLGREAMCQVTTLDMIDKLVTDRHPESGTILERIAAAGVEVIELDV